MQMMRLDQEARPAWAEFTSILFDLLALEIFKKLPCASMNQRCASGLTLLDCAKSAIEHFHKVRLRDASCRIDRYMLVTCEEGPDVIKVLDKYPFTHFMRTLKSVKAHDLTNIGASMQRVFGLLHLQRLCQDIDKFGQGRNPCSIDPTTIMLLTDGTELTTLAGVAQTLLPSGPVPVGADLSMQPFRWDQRVFASVLRIPSVSSAVLERSGPISQNGPISGSQSAVAMDSNISAFCEFTGGKCYVASSWKALMQHMELTATRLPPCVIVSFEHLPLPHSPSLPSQVHAACQRKIMLVRGGQAQGQGHWPIPEAFLVDPSHPGLPPREPHPIIAYKALDADPYIPANFIFDKYEFESNPILNFLLKAPAGVCWHVYIRNSKGSNGYGDPFGYLRINRGSTLTLYVLPYNFPVLWQLLDQLGKMPASSKHAPPPQWRLDMERYCHSIPPYYGPPLRKALKRWNLQAHVPDSVDSMLYNGSVGTQLERLKAQATEELAAEMSRIVHDQQNLGSSALKGMSRGQRLSHATPAILPTAEAPPGFNSGGSIPGAVKSPPTSRLSAVSAVHGHCDPLQPRKGWEVVIPAGPSGNIGSPSGLMKDMLLFKNPFDVARDQLLRQLRFFPLRVAMALDARKVGKDGTKGKGSLISTLAARLTAKEEDEARHSLPIEKMGDFNEALMKQQPPRNPFAEDQDRSKQQRFMFGNPYRQEKNDGADEAWLEGTGGPLLRGRKRRRRAESPGISGSPTSSGSAVDISAEGVAVNTEVTSPTRSTSDTPGPIAEGLKSGIAADAAKARGKTGDLRTIEPSGTAMRRDGKVELSRNVTSSILDTSVPEPRDEKKSIPSITEVRQVGAPGLAQVERVASGSENDSTVVSISTSTPVTEGLSRSRNFRRVRVVTPLGTEKDQGEVVEFLLNVFQVLRKTKSDDSQKLFDLLSIPDFPVDKANFVEQLICQAQQMNKLSVTKQLQDYSSKLLNPSAVAQN